MQLGYTEEDGYTLAVCEGQLDETAHQAFRESLHPLFVDRDVNVVVDVTGVPFINSEGIAAMVRLVADANTRGCRVIFAGPGTFMKEVLKVTRLDTYFELAPNRADAVATFEAEERSAS